MKDRWINIGNDEEDLKPFVEPEVDIGDQSRIGTHTHNLLVCNNKCINRCIDFCVDVCGQT